MKRKEIVEKMTLEEKAAILSGKTVWQTREIPRLGVPSLFCADGPHGIRKQAGAGDHLGLNASLPGHLFPHGRNRGPTAGIQNWRGKLGKLWEKRRPPRMYRCSLDQA